MSVRLYGRTVGNGSLAVVTAGFKLALQDAGLLEGVYPLDRSGGSEEEDAPPGALADDGVFTGNLSHVPVMMRNARHKRHWVQVTPNSTHVPPKLLDAIVRLPSPYILSASKWASFVIANTLQDMYPGFISLQASGNGYCRIDLSPDHRVEVPFLTVGHGVHGFAPWTEELAKTREDYERGSFRVVHFSTSDGERKGTLELLKAWVIFCSTNKAPDTPELLLVMDHHAREALSQRCLDEGFIVPPGVKFLPRADMGPTEMSRFLCQQHLLAAPSRGEGFGMIICESRASGVPCIATTTTGHSAGHVQGPGVIRIHQDSKLFPIDDGPGAIAPRVDPDAIAESLATAYSNWDGLSRMCEAASEQVQEAWSWENQLAPLVAKLKSTD